MTEREADMYGATLCRRIDRIVACLDEVTEEEARTPPPVPSSNCLLVLAVHSLANAEENILGVLGGRRVERNREREFQEPEHSIEEIRQRWTSLKSEVLQFLETCDPGKLDFGYQHPRRGRISGRKVLLTATVHAAEHVGHAELTRDWIVAHRNP